MKQIEIKLKGGNGQRIKSADSVLESTDFKTINNESVIGSGNIDTTSANKDLKIFTTADGWTSYNSTTKTLNYDGGIVNLDTYNGSSEVNTSTYVRENGVTPIISAVQDLRTDLNTQTSNLSTEITNRTNADTTLQTNITNEQNARIAADADLSDDLADEVTARQNADELKQNKNVVLYDTTVSNWVSDSTYSGYSYKADITITGTTASDIGVVSFSQAQVLTGNYAGICASSANTLTIYSKSNTSITIPTITILKNLRDLAAPSNVTVTNTNASFEEVANATSYEVFIDGTSIGEAV